MSAIIVARNPVLNFIVVGKSRDREGNFSLPVIVGRSGTFNWECNAYLTYYGGGSSSYNRKPLYSSVLKAAYSIGLFADFLDILDRSVWSTNDSTIYEFVKSLKERDIHDRSILTHGRRVLRLLRFLQTLDSDAALITKDRDPPLRFQVHYVSRHIVIEGRSVEQISHRAFDALSPIDVEHDFIRDEELEWWLDAINATKFHPSPTRFIVNRWLAFTLLLEISGSRISEVHSISRRSIKNFYLSSKSTDDFVKLGDIPVLKGSAKGRTREVVVPRISLQVIYSHVLETEEAFPQITHDAIFVNSDDGSALMGSYLKNYAKKVIRGSPFRARLGHVTNQSFRHRFVTLAIAKEMAKLGENGSFSNILAVAAQVCLKLTLHASKGTMARYVHLASTLNADRKAAALSNEPTPIRRAFRAISVAATSYKRGTLTAPQAMDTVARAIAEATRI